VLVSIVFGQARNLSSNDKLHCLNQLFLFSGFYCKSTPEKSLLPLATVPYFPGFWTRVKCWVTPYVHPFDSCFSENKTQIILLVWSYFPISWLCWRRHDVIEMSCTRLRRFCLTSVHAQLLLNFVRDLMISFLLLFSLGHSLSIGWKYGINPKTIC